MCGPFSTMVTRMPARARRSAGAAAPKPVPTIRTSVRVVRMVGSGRVAGGGERRGKKVLGIGIGDRSVTALVGALETDGRAGAGGVPQAGVVDRLGEEDRAVVEAARDPAFFDAGP